MDRVTYADYGKQAHQNIQELHERLKSKRCRVQPLRRVYIPKEDGKTQRPISISFSGRSIAIRYSTQLG